MALPHPVIFVPGITTSYLDDQYPLPPETVWSVLSKNYERSALHPDDTRYEALEPARVTAGQIYEIAYKELIEELRYNLRSREDQPVPVFPFGYDWRQPLETIEAQLADLIEEVIARTKLLKHYDEAGYAEDPKVSLVGHSMGGLVITGFLERSGAQSRVAKVATLATPFRGSFEAVIKITTGTANLGVDPPSSREREAARVTPALYYLLPSFERGLKIAPDLPDTLFDPSVWQPSIIETIEEYIRLHGLKRPKRRSVRARELFAAMLGAARAHRERIDGFRLSQAGLTANDWLCVVGVHTETRVRLEIVRSGRKPEFAFRAADRMDAWTADDPEQRRLTGDGTVPFAGARPPFLALENLVCVTPDDFGYWEVRDRALAATAGLHGMVPNMNMLHRLIVRHLTGRPDRRRNTWGRRAPGVAEADWAPALPGLWDKGKGS